MPIFAYRCDSCGFEKDVLQKRSDPPLDTCPACSSETFRKRLTAPAFQLKGSGWYVTDFRDGGKAKSKPGESGEAAGEAAGGAAGGAASQAAGNAAGNAAGAIRLRAHRPTRRRPRLRPKGRRSPPSRHRPRQPLPRRQPARRAGPRASRVDGRGRRERVPKGEPEERPPRERTPDSEPEEHTPRANPKSDTENRPTEGRHHQTRPSADAARLFHHRTADLGSAGHHAVGAEPDREHDGPEPGAAAGPLASAHAARSRHPWAGDAAHHPGDLPHRAADPKLPRAATRPRLGDGGLQDSDRQLHLLEREAGQRHALLARRQGVSQGAAGPVSAPGRLDDRVSDRHAGAGDALRASKARWSRSTFRRPPTPPPASF